MVKIIELDPEKMIFQFADEEVENTYIFQDVKMFLAFIQKEKPKLTQVSHNLTRKDIYLLNAHLKAPDKLDLEVNGKIISRLADETQAKTLHFIKNLSLIGRLIKRYRNRLILTTQAKEYLKKPSFLYFHLWQTWLFHYNWLYQSFLFEEKVIQTFQDNFPLLALFLLEEKGNWLTTQSFFAKSLSLDPNEFASTFERVVVEKLNYFSIIEAKKEKDKLGWEKILAFRLTPFGEKIFKTTFLVRPPPIRVD